MDIFQIIVISAVFFLAAFVKGVTGLGFSTTCIPFLALLLGVKEAIALVLLPSIVSNIFTMRAAGHFSETVNRFRFLLLATIPGLLLGLWFLADFKSETSAFVLGTVLILYSTFTLIHPEFRLQSRFERILSIPAGLLTGLVNGMTGSQVMPVLPYLMALHLDNDRFVQALNCSFTLGSLIMLSGMTMMGQLTTPVLMVSLSGMLFVYLGVKAGSLIRKKISIKIFRLLILCFLISAGISLTFPALLSFRSLL